MENLVTFQQFLFQIGRLSATQLSELGAGAITPDGLARSGYITREDVNFYWQQFQKLQQIDLEQVNVKDLIPIPVQFAKLHKLLAINLPDKQQTLAAVTNPINISAIDEVTQYCQYPIAVQLAHQKQVEKFIGTYLVKTRDRQQAMIHSLASLDLESKVDEKAGDEVFRESGIVSKIVRSIIDQAVIEKSTDIHIEANRSSLKVYYRISKEMKLIFDLNVSLTNVLRQKLMMMGNGEITNLRGIQDLGFRIESGGDELAIRFSYLPTLEGYSIVMRVIYQNMSYDLKKIIQDPNLFNKVDQFMSIRQGMMLVTGPTSSGKSTLLYGILSEMQGHGGLKIITIEDPVETRLEGVNQVQVDADTGIDYADFIRASLRQNPDIIMLSEIRDSDTALIATRAAMTGIMVLATLHTQSAMHTVTRLLDLGIDSFLIGAGVRMIVAIRLLAKLCPHCRETQTLSEEALIRLNAMRPDEDWKTVEVWKKVGCLECEEKGYLGYQSITEVLNINVKLREKLYDNALQNFYELAQASLAGQTLLDKALDHFRQGEIDLPTLYQLSEN